MANDKQPPKPPPVPPRMQPMKNIIKHSGDTDQVVIRLLQPPERR